MEIAITAIGTATPAFTRNQEDTAELVAAGLHLKASEKRLLKSVYKSTGIKQRHSVLGDYCRAPGSFEVFPNNPVDPFPSTATRMRLYQENAFNLGLSAINQCFASQPEFNKEAITHVITVSCTGMYAPGLDIEIVHHLGLNTQTKRTAINFMGCYGAFNALKVAESICVAEPTATVLILCVELCTLHFQKNINLDNLISNAIFSDGASAVLVQANPLTQKYFRIDHFHCDLVPQTSKEMAWNIADFGFDIVLSSYVPQSIQSGIARFAQALLKQKNLSDIDFYAIHPGGLKILQACEAALGIAPEHNKYAYQVLQNFGNMSSATIFFVLKAIWDDLNTTDHDKTIFSCAFGPGLTLESMLLKTAALH